MTERSARDLTVAAAVGVATAAAFTPMLEVFADGAWVVPTAVTALASLTLAVVVRRLGLSNGVALLVSIVAWAIVSVNLHLVDARLVPWVDELRALRDLAGAGVLSVRDQAAPAPTLPELVFLVATGAWWVTFTAHELAVRLRTAGVALVPLAAMWIVPMAMPQAEPPGRLLALPFLFAAALVLLVESDSDLAGWARDRVRPRVTVAGASIATGAILVGVLAPGLLPGIGDPAVLDVGTGRDPRGYQPIVDIGDRLALPIDRPVLRVRTDQRSYLRLAALDTYDDNTWRVGPPGQESFRPADAQLFATRDPLPFETPIETATTARVAVEVLDLENIYVPTPYQPVEVTGPGAGDMVWSQVGGFLATGELSENEIGGTLRTGVVPGFSYEITAAVPDPAIERLRQVATDGPELDAWRQLPGDQGRWRPYADLAQLVWDDAGATTTIDRVLALQDWFTDTGGFEYSLSDIDPLRGSTALETFLFETKVGYCEYFSTAMAVMLRASGIPARTAVGFLPGERVEETAADATDPRDTYEVTTGDAHAWVEVLFPGQGWITFDPTPRSDGATLAPEEQDLTPEQPVAERDAAEDASDEPSTDDGADAEVPSAPDLQDPLSQDRPGLQPGEIPTADGGSSRWLVLALLAGLVVVATLVWYRRGRADDTARTAAVAAQRRVLEHGERLGVGRRTSETGPEVLHRYASDGLVDPAAAAQLAALAQRAAFSRDGADVDGTRATALADDLVAQLRASAPRRTRLLSPVRAPVTRGLTQARELVGLARDRLSP